MTHLRRDIDNPVAFKRLMRLGHIAHIEGDYKQAHISWQQAAMMQPDNEEVWVALLRVLRDEDDRRVCLRNILAINPQNNHAQSLLDELAGDTQPPDQNAKAAAALKNRRISVRQITLRILESAFIGILIAIGMLGVRYLLF
ncbi:MAG: hypothetical protein Q9P01_18895 [Anaerolineae bacterium]|nr:hypothetical protein [Anaerolineae bacterium]MDQ7036819.1 hypothetical protein [Anaerolineae bacterium]